MASFDLDSTAGGDAKKAIERTFSPEFRNRLDGWIAFSSLPMEVVEKIVDVLWDRLRIELHNKTFSEIEFELYRLLEEAEADERAGDRGIGVKELRRRHRRPRK